MVNHLKNSAFAGLALALTFIVGVCPAQAMEPESFDEDSGGYISSAQASGSESSDEDSGSYVGSAQARESESSSDDDFGAYTGSKLPECLVETGSIDQGVGRQPIIELDVNINALIKAISTLSKVDAKPYKDVLKMVLKDKAAFKDTSPVQPKKCLVETGSINRGVSRKPIIELEIDPTALEATIASLPWEDSKVYRDVLKLVEKDKAAFESTSRVLSSESESSDEGSEDEGSE